MIPGAINFPEVIKAMYGQNVTQPNAAKDAAMTLLQQSGATPVYAARGDSVARGDGSMMVAPQAGSFNRVQSNTPLLDGYVRVAAADYEANGWGPDEAIQKANAEVMARLLEKKTPIRERTEAGEAEALKTKSAKEEKTANRAENRRQFNATFGLQEKELGEKSRQNQFNNKLAIQQLITEVLKSQMQMNDPEKQARATLYQQQAETPVSQILKNPDFLSSVGIKKTLSPFAIFGSPLKTVGNDSFRMMSDRLQLSPEVERFFLQQLEKGASAEQLVKTYGSLVSGMNKQ